MASTILSVAIRGILCLWDVKIWRILVIDLHVQNRWRKSAVDILSFSLSFQLPQCYTAPHKSSRKALELEDIIAWISYRFICLCCRNKATCVLGPQWRSAHPGFGTALMLRLPVHCAWLSILQPSSAPCKFPQIHSDMPAVGPADPAYATTRRGTMRSL